MASSCEHDDKLTGSIDARIPLQTGGLFKRDCSMAMVSTVQELAIY